MPVLYHIFGECLSTRAVTLTLAHNSHQPTIVLAGAQLLGKAIFHPIGGDVGKGYFINNRKYEQNNALMKVTKHQVWKKIVFIHFI